ncbi:uncharacterized protein METZ01_LOCUS406745, partial [marine metagenome]
YTVFFASERNKYSRSIQVSRTNLLVLLFFGIIVFGLAIIGAFRIFNQDELTREIINLKKSNILLQNVLDDVEYSSILDSLGSYQEFVSDFYLTHQISYPNEAPVEGYVTRGLNIEKNHFGIDIAAKYQDDIYSPGNGSVIFSGLSEDLGNTIIINHPRGFVTVYAHNDSNLVTSGMHIEKGQVLARVGETRNSQGPHLHFEIWKNNQVLDPRVIIPDYKKKDVSIR